MTKHLQQVASFTVEIVCIAMDWRAMAEAPPVRGLTRTPETLGRVNLNLSPPTRVATKSNLEEKIYSAALKPGLKELPCLLLAC